MKQNRKSLKMTIMRQISFFLVKCFQHIRMVVNVGQGGEPVLVVILECCDIISKKINFFPFSVFLSFSAEAVYKTCHSW